MGESMPVAARASTLISRYRLPGTSLLPVFLAMSRSSTKNKALL
jgi:hypothetical protein